MIVAKYKDIKKRAIMFYTNVRIKIGCYIILCSLILSLLYPSTIIKNEMYSNYLFITLSKQLQCIINIGNDYSSVLHNSRSKPGILPMPSSLVGDIEELSNTS